MTEPAFQINGKRLVGIYPLGVRIVAMPDPGWKLTRQQELALVPGKRARSLAEVWRADIDREDSR